MAEMIHVIRQMQMYTQIEVIAVRWKNLLSFVHKKEGDLDSLIAAHKFYLTELVNKTLMISGKQGKEVNHHFFAISSTLNNWQDAVLDRVRQLFNVILQFREAVVRLGVLCVQRRLSHILHRMNFITSHLLRPRGGINFGMKKGYALTHICLSILVLMYLKGVFTGVLQNPSAEHDDNIGHVLDRIKEYGTAFTEGAQVIVQALLGHTDPDCKDLAARLNFTRHYYSNKEQHQKG